MVSFSTLCLGPERKTSEVVLALLGCVCPLFFNVPFRVNMGPIGETIVILLPNAYKPHYDRTYALSLVVFNY